MDAYKYLYNIYKNVRICFSEYRGYNLVDKELDEKSFINQISNSDRFLLISGSFPENFRIPLLRNQKLVIILAGIDTEFHAKSQAFRSLFRSLSDKLFVFLITEFDLKGNNIHQLSIKNTKFFHHYTHKEFCIIKPKVNGFGKYKILSADEYQQDMGLYGGGIPPFILERDAVCTWYGVFAGEYVLLTSVSQSSGIYSVIRFCVKPIDPRIKIIHSDERNLIGLRESFKRTVLEEKSSSK
jgi:hypothetical protein